MRELLKLTNVGCRLPYQDTGLFENVNLIVNEGENILITGKTGSGKTILTELFVGFRKPSHGQISRIRDLTLVPQNFTLYPDLSAIENLVFYRCLNGVNIEPKAMMERLKIDDCDKTPSGKLPAGKKKMLQLAVALTYRFSLLVLDDFNTGLDDEFKEICFEIIDELRKSGKSVILVTSQKEETTIFSRNLLIKEKTLIEIKAEETIINQYLEDISR